MKRTSFFVFTFIIFSFLSPSLAQALTVSPARLEVSGDPGQTIQGQIVIFDEVNDSNPLGKDYYISYENFEPRGDSGAPYFIGAKDGLATWITTQDKITLNNQSETKVPFSITIPQNTKPGGYFAAVFFGTQPTNNVTNSEVSVGGKVGVLILLRVNGEIEEKGGLLSFGLIDGKRFQSTLPITFEYRFNNVGGDRIVPKGTVTVLNTFRFKSDVLDANPSQGSVLPGSSRKFQSVLGDFDSQDIDLVESRGFFNQAKKQFANFKFGWYTAKLDLVWGNTSQKTVSSYNFFIIPWQALVIILAGLFVILKGFKFMLIRYNRWILKQAGVYQQQNTQSVHQHSHSNIKLENTEDQNIKTGEPDSEETKEKPQGIQRLHKEKEVHHKKIIKQKTRRRI